MGSWLVDWGGMAVGIRPVQHKRVKV